LAIGWQRGRDFRRRQRLRPRTCSRGTRPRWLSRRLRGSPSFLSFSSASPWWKASACCLFCPSRFLWPQRPAFRAARLQGPDYKGQRPGVTARCSACGEADRLKVCTRGLTAVPRRGLTARMAEGTIKRLTDKGFGFIETGSGQDLFFHTSAVQGVRFEDLKQGQRVSFTVGQGPKGPRAENVKPI
jgi:CspA family cold shock protein